MVTSHAFVTGLTPSPKCLHPRAMTYKRALCILVRRLAEERSAPVGARQRYQGFIKTNCPLGQNWGEFAVPCPKCSMLAMGRGLRKQGA